MNDNYVVLPRKTKQLLFSLCNLYESHAHDALAYREAMDISIFSPGYNHDDLINQLKTLVHFRYLNDEANLIPTDTGLSYSYLERRFLCYRYMIPAAVAFTVSLATNFLLHVFIGR